MKIHRRIKTGKLKGWTIRKSKYGWFSLYSENGICQSNGKLSQKEIQTLINEQK